jgi:hypothetical protein
VLRLHARRPAPPPLRRDCIPRAVYRALPNVRAYLRRRRVRVCGHDSAACARGSFCVRVAGAGVLGARPGREVVLRNTRRVLGFRERNSRRLRSLLRRASPAVISELSQHVYACQSMHLLTYCLL